MSLPSIIPAAAPSHVLLRAACLSLKTSREASSMVFTTSRNFPKFLSGEMETTRSASLRRIQDGPSWRKYAELIRQSGRENKSGLNADVIRGCMQGENH